jgi:hypothetical protein
MTTVCEQIVDHYRTQWGNDIRRRQWSNGPASDLPSQFCILELPPTNSRRMWTYATCCMSQCHSASRIELHVFSPFESRAHVELLTAIYHYHCTGNPLGHAHTVNFGRPWLPGSGCDHGLISLPYLDGPKLEVLTLPAEQQIIRFLWLIPITPSERDFTSRFGLDALECRFQETNVNYVDPYRKSIV